MPDEYHPLTPWRPFSTRPNLSNGWTKLLNGNSDVNGQVTNSYDVVLTFADANDRTTNHSFLRMHAGSGWADELVLSQCENGVT
jgi:hypothetical protein